MLKTVCDSESYTVCRYRNPDGLKCAVGEFIPDEVYDPRFESYGISGNTFYKHLDAIVPYMPLEAEAMGRLQHVHDKESEPESTVNQRLIDWVNENVE